MSLGDDAGAWSLFKESAATLQKKFGNENTELAIVVSNWGVLAESLDRTETAKTLYEHALAIRLKAFGEDHPAVGDTLSHLGSLSLKLGDTPRALDLIQKGLTIRVRSFGREHLSVSSSLNLLADAHMATVRPRSGEAGRLAGSDATNDQSLVTSAATNGEVRLLTSAATRALSRSYRGIKFGPLPGSEAEAMNVAKLLGGDTVLRLGAEAREAELKAVVSPRVLHLATHGFFLTDQEFKRTNAGPGLLAAGARSRRGNEADLVASLRSPPPHVGGYDDWENPMVRCGIALAGANHAAHITNAVAEDGLLTGLEASLLNLQGTELVILSACESGAGEVKIGEGVMSLRRAFRIAGAETVLASHWKVSDQATSRLMTEFMRRWRAGEPRAKAWREAQLALLRSEKFSNPYFWAAFTLTGQWR